MKILNIYFKNINSLEGESRIDFDRAPISDAGVFAITGPNGSGKTSILDAITLALYGETYRFDKPAEHVMTKQSLESFAQVEFMLGEQKFRSSWRVSRIADSPESELSAPEMTLTKLNGEEALLEQTPAQVRTRIAELTGMDFHKFTKSMVLAQGDFSAFLNALDSERMDILEKIAGADIYQQYRERIELKYEQAKTQLGQIEEDLTATPILDDSAVEAAQHDLDDFNEQLAEFGEDLATLDKQLAWLDTLDTLQQKRDETDGKRQSLEEDRERNKQLLQRIEEVRPALVFKEDIAELDKKTEQVAQSEKSLSAYRSEEAMLQQQLAGRQADQQALQQGQSIEGQKQKVDQLKLKISELKQTLPEESSLLQSIQQQLQEKNANLEFVENWLREHDADKGLLDNFPETGKLKSLRLELAELKNKQKSHAKWSKNTTSALKKNKAAIKSASKEIKLLEKKLATDQQTIKDRTHGKSFEELEELKAEQQERVSDFLELFELAQVNARINKKGFFSFLKSSRHDIELEEQELIDRQNALQLEIAKEENIRKALEKAVAQEALLKRMQADRDKLEDGKPCPLCGALKHPYVKRPPMIGDSKKALADQRGKVQDLMTRSDSLRLQLKEVREREALQSDKDKQLQKVRSQWRILTNRLNVASDRLDIDNLTLMKKLLKAEKQQFVDINKLIKKCSKLHLTIERTKTDIAKNQALLEELKAANEELDQEWDNRPRELVELEKAYEKCKADEKALTDVVTQRLTALGETMPTKGQEDALFDRLNLRRQEYQTHMMRRKVLLEEIASLNEKVGFCQEDVDELTQKLQEQVDLLQNEEAVALHLALLEKQKMIVDKEQGLASQQQELRDLTLAIQDKLSESTFESLEELRESLALIEQRQELEQQLQTQQNELQILSDDLVELDRQLQEQHELALTEKDRLTLSEEQNQLLEKRNIAELEVKSLQDKLKKQASMREKFDRLQQQLQDQQTILKSCEEDMRLLSDENSLQFRQKVQRDMGERLLSKANQVLEKISGRYYVRSEASEQGFALRIEDTKQNNSRRLPKTLSGGESFVVSLALALALAEIAHNGHALNSLFLDEGFGNLDAESLYLVMTTLEGLKTHGKLVGIISHVEGVKKRVKTQIEMIKKPNGLSSMKIAS